MTRLSKKERERQQRIANCSFGVHEALHTAHVLLDSYSYHVCEHPAVALRPDVAALAQKALRAMCDVYQAIGALDVA